MMMTRILVTARAAALLCFFALAVAAWTTVAVDIVVGGITLED